MKLNLHSLDDDHYDKTDENPYPYVIERLMPGVFIRINVVFTGMPTPMPDTRAYYIDQPEAFARCKLNPEARAKLVDAVSRASRDTNHRMCAVFAPREAVYCDPDGSRKESTDIPSGGVLFTEPDES